MGYKVFISHYPNKGNILSHYSFPHPPSFPTIQTPPRKRGWDKEELEELLLSPEIRQREPNKLNRVHRVKLQHTINENQNCCNKKNE